MTSVEPNGDSNPEKTDVTTPPTPSNNELAAQRTHLAASRNLMAADRSLMAWIRTALSLISFGFTIYKLLQGLQESGATRARHIESPRVMGLLLTALGTMSIVMGTVEYGYRLKDLQHLEKFRLLRPAFVMALIMCLTGLALFVSISGKLV